MAYYAHPTAVIDQPCSVGDGTKIWHFVHICAGAQIGRDCILGQNVMVAANVIIGNNVKIQNNVTVYTGTTIEDDVFLGPSCVLTNVTNPRSQVRRHGLFEKTLLRRGATVGANATIICGITLGRYCFVAAAAVVTKDVPDYALMVGVPARQKGWISRHGHKMKADSAGQFRCPESGFRYVESTTGVLHCLDCDENDSLSAELSEGKFSHDYFKRISCAKED